LQRDKPKLPVIDVNNTNEVQNEPPGLPPAFHVMTKPVGAICNLDCKYCFYLEKENLYLGTTDWEMPEEILLEIE
jgi:sulfatase maturation enzyme AslB (radical SAM superfamily)